MHSRHNKYGHTDIIVWVKIKIIFIYHINCNNPVTSEQLTYLQFSTCVFWLLDLLKYNVLNWFDEKIGTLLISHPEHRADNNDIKSATLYYSTKIDQAYKLCRTHFFNNSMRGSGEKNYTVYEQDSKSFDV